MNSMELPDYINNFYTTYKTNLKAGKVTHKIIDFRSKKDLQEQINALLKLYETVSGSPRIYIDNTLDFLTSKSENKNSR